MTRTYETCKVMECRRAPHRDGYCGSHCSWSREEQNRLAKEAHDRLEAERQRTFVRRAAQSL